MTKVIAMMTTPVMLLDSIAAKIGSGEAMPPELYRIDFTAIHAKVETLYGFARAREGGHTDELGLTLADATAAVKAANNISKQFSYFVIR